MISLNNVTREFHLDDTTVITPVHNISMEIQRGEFLMIVGRSGSGKTTLLNLCSGLIRPTEGRVLIEGNDINNLNDSELSAVRSRKIGFIFQFQSMLSGLTVIENVAMPAAAAKSREGDPFKRAAQLLEAVGLKDRMNVFPRQLSGGELKRVAIARALMNQPEIILADEPTADLDVNTESSIMSLLRQIHKSGVTIVMITHNLSLVRYASRALSMENGRLMPFNIPEDRPEPAGMAPPAAHPVVPASEGSGLEPALLFRQDSMVRPVKKKAKAKIRALPVVLVIGCMVLIAGSLGFLLPENSSPKDQAAASIDAARAAVSAPRPVNAISGLAALQQFDRLSNSFAAAMQIEFYGTESTIPTRFNSAAVPIKWETDTFKGILERSVSGASVIDRVSGRISEKGDTLVSLVCSQEIIQGISNKGTFFAITLKNVPLASVVNSVSSGSGKFEKSGQELRDYVEKIEYAKGTLNGSSIEPVTVFKSVDWEAPSPVPAITLLFQNSAIIKNPGLAPSTASGSGM